MVFCQLITPSILLVLCLLAARERSFFTDLFGLSILVPFVTVSYIFNIVPSLKIDSEEGTNYLLQTTALFYLTACHFMSTNFLISMVTRVVCVIGCLALRALSWSSDSRDFSILVFSGFCLFLVVFIESANYCSMRSKALLFQRVKEMGRQEQQLSNLLDAVPDKVLISTRALEAKAPKSVYSNRQMNTFYGCNMAARNITANRR